MLLCHLWKVVKEKVRLTIRWVRGHSGDVENTIADGLADVGTGRKASLVEANSADGKLG